MERSFELRNAIKVAICAEPSRDAQHHLAKIAASALLGNFTFDTDGSDQFWRETRALLPPPPRACLPRLEDWRPPMLAGLIGALWMGCISVSQMQR